MRASRRVAFTLLACQLEGRAQATHRASCHELAERGSGGGNENVRRRQQCRRFASAQTWARVGMCALHTKAEICTTPLDCCCCCCCRTKNLGAQPNSCASSLLLFPLFLLLPLPCALADSKRLQIRCHFSLPPLPADAPTHCRAPEPRGTRE